MADDTTSSRQDVPSEGGRDQNNRGQEMRQGGNRQGGNREPGGFRIRLSDNEMRAARAVQEAFQLRSTVAALGFSIRTVAQMLDDGQLDELVAQQRSQAAPQRNSGGGRPEGRGRDGRGGGQGGGGQGGGGHDRAPRANPFARPSKPPAPVAIPGIEDPASAPPLELDAALVSETAQSSEPDASPAGETITGETMTGDAPTEA